MVNHKNKILCPINNLPARHYASKGRAEYYIEPKQGVIFQRELPSVAEMEIFVQQEYKSGSYRAYAEMELLKKRTAERRLNRIRQYGAPGKRLLDVGCSVGIFLEAALDFGFDAHGVELSSQAVAMAKERVRERITQADVNEHIRKGGARYDAITAYDIIEHTQDPTAFLKDLYDALEPGGVVAIATPDTDHFLRYVMGKRWSMLQPMQHTFLFSKRSMKVLLAEAGFEAIEVEPAYKTLTANYLFGQLSQTNPLISRLYNSVSGLIPRWIGDAPLNINIGEFFALGRKPAGITMRNP